MKDPRRIRWTLTAQLPPPAAGPRRPVPAAGILTALACAGVGVCLIGWGNRGGALACLALWLLGWLWIGLKAEAP